MSGHGRRAASGVAVAAAVLAACVHYQPRPVSAPASLTALESRTLDSPALGRFLEANHEVAGWPPAAWDLKTLTLAAFYYHPDLEVARRAWASARAAEITAGERPNPGGSFAPGYNTTTPASEITPWILTLDLDFTIETAGKRGHRIAEARALSEAARLEIATVAWQVRSRVRQALLDLYAAGRTEALLRSQLAVQESVVALLARQLDAGAVSAFEPTQARLELDRLRLALHDVTRQQAEARVRLASALGVAARALDGVRLDASAFDRPPPDVPPDAARRRALVNRPDILGALAEYAASQAALQLEIAKQYPDIHLGPGYQMDQTDSKWTLGLSSILPIFTRNRGPIAEAEARRAEVAARFTAVQANALGEIDLALAAYRGAVAKAAATDAMLGDLQKQEQSARAQYDAGEISRLELDGIQLQLVGTQLARLDAHVSAEQALGQLEDAIQGPAGLTDWLAAGPPQDPGRVPGTAAR